MLSQNVICGGALLVYEIVWFYLGKGPPSLPVGWQVLLCLEKGQCREY